MKGVFVMKRIKTIEENSKILMAGMAIGDIQFSEGVIRVTDHASNNEAVVIIHHMGGAVTRVFIQARSASEHLLEKVNHLFRFNGIQDAYVSVGEINWVKSPEQGTVEGYPKLYEATLGQLVRVECWV